MVVALSRQRSGLGPNSVIEGKSLNVRSSAVILGDDALAVAHQMNQHIEHLRPDRDRLGSAAELPPIRIEHVLSEHNLHGGAP
jgi:hypothetical protein